MSDPMLTPQRIVRPLRNIDLKAIDELAGDEKLSRADMIRLMLSFATFKWEPDWCGSVGEDTYSVKLLPLGIDVIKTLAERELISWDTMASHLLAFAVATWQPGWRKDVPGPLGRAGINKHALNAALSV